MDRDRRLPEDLRDPDAFPAPRPQEVDFIAPFGDPEAVFALASGNFDPIRSLLERCVGGVEARLFEARHLAFPIERAALFSARVSEGRVREGHGDLRLEHVYLDERGAFR